MEEKHFNGELSGRAGFPTNLDIREKYSQAVGVIYLRHNAIFLGSLYEYVIHAIHLDVLSFFPEALFYTSKPKQIMLL